MRAARAAVVAVAMVVAGCGRIGFDGRAAPAADASLSYADAVLADHPIAYWRLGDPSGSDVARDEMGDAAGKFDAGCAQGVPGALAGDANTAVRFDGATCGIGLADVAELDFFGTSTFTLEVWVANTSTDAYYHYVTRETRNSGNPVDGYAMLQSDSAPAGVYLERSVAGSVVQTPPVVLGTTGFVHLVGTYDGTQLQLTIDGVAGTPVSDARAIPSFAVNPLLGRQPNGAYLDGVLDEVAIYDHVLAPDRIAIHRQIALDGPR